MKRSRGLFLWIAVFLLAAPMAMAQSDFARVTGKVLDENGDPVPNLTINFEAAPGSPAPAFSVTTNKKGRFTHGTAQAGQFNPRLAGDYRVTRIQVKMLGAASIAMRAFAKSSGHGTPPPPNPPGSHGPSRPSSAVSTSRPSPSIPDSLLARWIRWTLK